MKRWKRRVSGGLLAFIGFMLSPLSWWNDLFVNIPLAVGFGWLIGLVYGPAFEAGVVLGYWLTNLLGFVLLHKGTVRGLGSGDSRPYSRRDLLRDVLVSLAYTALILVLAKWGIIQPVADYFAKG